MSYQEDKLMNLKDGRLLLKTIDERMKTNGFAPVMTNPYPDTIKTLENCAENMGMGIEIPIAPVQDLHGYSSPWVGGAGKNKLPITGNTATIQGVAWTVNENGTITAKRSSSSSNNSDYTVNSGITLPAGSYVFTFSDSDGSGTTYQANCKIGGTSNWGVRARAFTLTEDTNVEIVVRYYPDFSDEVVIKPMIRLASETDATFAPYENVCPISGFTGVDITRTGKNLFDPNATNTDNGYKANYYIGSSGSLASDSDLNVSEYISVLPNTQYEINPVSGNSVGLCFYDSLKQYISGINYGVTWGTYISKTFTTPPDTAYVRCSIPKTKANQLTLKVYNVYSITWESAGTVYGGTVTINEDGSGVLVGNMAKYTYTGEESFSYSTGTHTYYETHGCPGIKRKAYTVAFDGISSKFAPYSGTPIWSNITSGCYVGYLGDSSDGLRFSINGGEVSDFASIIAGTEVVYELATPIEYTLTPQQITSLFGTNTLWNSIGTFSVSYHIDPKIYVDDTAGMAGSIAVTDSTEASVKTLTDGAENLPMEVTVGIDPVQDLHGQDSPWVGGAGKNLSPITVESIKSASSDLTWNGNSATSNDITFTILTDSDGNVTGINVNGTATGTAILTMYNKATCPFAEGSYKMNGLWASGSGSTFKHDLIYLPTPTSSNTVLAVDMTAVTGTDVVVTQAVLEGINFKERLVIYSGQALTNVKFYPMIRLSTDTDATFAPYSNICPISGWDSVQITRTGKNLLDISSAVLNKNIDASGNIVDNNSFMYMMTKVKSGADYMLSFNSVATSTTTTTRIHAYDKYGNWKQQIGSVSSSDAGARTKAISIPNDVDFVAVSARQSFTDFMLEEGSTKTAYEPFGTTYHITFPSLAGVIYGGTLTINKDGSGKLVVNHAMEIFDGSEDESWSIGTPTRRFYINAQNNTVGNDPNAFCNEFKAVAELPSPANDVVWIQLTSTANRINIYFNDSNKPADVTALRTWLASNPLEVCYSIATPVSFDLTASKIRSLLGVNNIWADSGNVLNVVYYANNKLYIDNLFNSIIPATGVSF